MLDREFYYRWEVKLSASAEALWPLLSDTNRFNRDTGYPKIKPLPPASGMAQGRRRLSLRTFGQRLDWVEDPFEWIYPYHYGVVRRYFSGPVAELRTLAELNPQPDGGTLVIYQVWAKPRNLLGLAAIPLQVGVLSARSFRRTFFKYDEVAAQGKNALDLPAKVHFPPGGRARLENLRQRLLEQGASSELVGRLVQTIERVDDFGVSRLRPYALADYWGVPRREVLEMCLRATRLGLLDFRWDLLCPLCRGAKKSGASLSEVERRVHCDACNIDFDVNFDRSVELTFRPNPAVRDLRLAEYCTGGPQLTPHIVAQQLMPPGENRTLSLPLEPGRYRLRAPGLPGGQYLLAVANGDPECTVQAREPDWSHDEPRVSLNPTLRLENTTGKEQLLILERMAWADHAVTAAEVTSLQLFRDLFADEALRPGEQISVGSLTILFTDLKGSTRLYREIGDAPAFGRVMNHFDVLRKAIADEEGALVKTIGDAVMAVFLRPSAALRAMLKAQNILANPPDGALPLMLKAGIHYGPCIAVTLNDRLDYFGSTVNIGARLEGLSTGGDIVITETVRHDPEVAELLAGLSCGHFEAMLKGFDEERFSLYRISGLPPESMPLELKASGLTPA